MQGYAWVLVAVGFFRELLGSGTLLGLRVIPESIYAENGGFKFAMNDDWTVSWGGANGNPAAYDNLSQNGGKDLETPAGEGTYEIKLYLSCEGKNRVVLTKK